jgi:hypothetical protein
VPSRPVPFQTAVALRIISILLVDFFSTGTRYGTKATLARLPVAVPTGRAPQQFRQIPFR